MSLLDQVATRLPFRWADFAVAAGIFIAGTLTLLPAIHRSRERMNQAGCVFNLQQLGNSLAQYASLHPFLPYPPSTQVRHPRRNVRRDASRRGRARQPVAARLPVQRAMPARDERARELRSGRSDPKDRSRGVSPMLCWDYAYNVGYRHASRSGPGPLEVVHSSQIPVLADQPDHQDFLTIREGNSPNHGRRGQNVLFGDGSVRWFYSRLVGPHDPDLYLNNDHQPRPGVDVSDSVLMPSKVPFSGR